MFFCIIILGDILKKTLNETILEKAVNYLKYEYNNFKFDQTLRSKYLNKFLTKYIRTIESIKILDLKSYQKRMCITVNNFVND
mgnify:CR=1 FL=1